MEIVKKNILSVICGVIALIALFALIWPVSGMYADQQVVLDSRKKADSEIIGLLKGQRYWPVIPDLQSGEKSQLKDYPTEANIQAGISIKDKVHAQAASMGGNIVRDNRRDPLLAGTLPNPGDQRFAFQQAYLAQVQDTPKGPCVLHTELEGTAPPTDQDVLDEAARMWTSEYLPKVLTVGGQQVNYPQVLGDWQKACSSLQAKMRLAAAHKGKVYLDPGWISIQKAMILIGASPKDPDIWFAQNMLWVQMDLVDAIKRLNAGSKSVEDSTIKHVFKMDVPDEAGMYVMSPNASPNSAPADPSIKVFSVSPTGRVSNSLYDVIQFDLVMNVEAAKIPIILTELQKGKLITILRADHSAVNGIAAAENGYIYGNVGVARLTIHGEELFLRDWTSKLMPAPIIAMLQVPATSGNPAIR